MPDIHRQGFNVGHKTGDRPTSYYYAGSTRIAMRLKNLYSEQVYYFFSDHLGSTNVMTEGNGNVVTELMYKAWGEVRYSSGSSPTDFTYTGQRSEMDDIGLMFYNARFYDPQLGRFAQADNIIPAKRQPISWDRFVYARNNPILFNDPSGHDVGCSAADPKCWEQNALSSTDATNESETDGEGMVLRGHNLVNFQTPLRKDEGDANKYWWSPLTYDTLEIKIGGMVKSIAGFNADVSIFTNWKALRNFDLADADVSYNINLSFSLGVSGEV